MREAAFGATESGPGGCLEGRETGDGQRARAVASVLGGTAGVIPDARAIG